MNKEEDDERWCSCGKVHAGSAWAANPELRGCPRCNRPWPEYLVRFRGERKK